MSFILRPYQVDAVNAGLEYFSGKKKGNELIVAPTGCGKSIIIANIAKELDGEVVILQPNVEILQQNFEKYTQQGFRAGIYSDKAGVKFKDRVTFATIKSIISKKHLFDRVKFMIIDEAHDVNPEEGQYWEFIKYFEKVKVLGLTASPYRLSSGQGGSTLKFLTRTSPRIFNRVAHTIQIGPLFEAGYLAPLKYYNFDVVNRSVLNVNSTGSDFDFKSLKDYYKRIDFPKIAIEYSNRILAKRKHLLVFCTMVEEAERIAKGIPGAVAIHGDTPKELRPQYLKKFKAGEIPCIVNVKVLDTGFDFPGLEAMLMAKSTMSLARWYQSVGRVIRPYTYPDGTKKTGWVVDLGNNLPFFGPVEKLLVKKNHKDLWVVHNGKRQLTNVVFQK